MMLIIETLRIVHQGNDVFSLENYYRIREPGQLVGGASDSSSKGCEFESRQERRKNVLFRGQLCVLTLIRCPFHPLVTGVARKKRRSFCRKCRWQVIPKHAYTLDPPKLEWADYAALQAWCGNPLGNELSRSLSGNTRPQLPQPAEPLWTDPGLKSGISVRNLIPPPQKKKKSAGGE